MGAGRVIDKPPTRRPIVVGNWKMNTTSGEGLELGAGIKTGLAGVESVEIVVCPPFTSLKPVGDLIRDSRVKLGAQNMHQEPGGAYTGEISAAMLVDLGCEFVILGHSERREHLNEADELINRKVQAALVAQLTPILCVGETLAERERGDAEEVVHTQLDGSLKGLSSELGKLIVAYEPVWAIGTGRTAATDEAQAAHSCIRKWIRRHGGPEIAQGQRILYGGSVKPGNAADLFSQSDVDGGLIGGASLGADSFVQIVRAAVAPESRR